MHIAICSLYHFSTYKGGNERHAQAIANGLVSLGHTVTYISSSPEPKQQLAYSYIHLPVVHFLGKPLPTFYWFNPPQIGPIDLIHTFGSGLPLISLARSFTERHIPVIHLFQAPSHSHNILFSFGTQVEIKGINRYATAIITTSPGNMEYLKQGSGFNRPCHLVPLYTEKLFLNSKNSKSSARLKLGLDANQPIVLFVGNLDHHHTYKGLSVLLKAISLLPKNIHLYIVGSGDRKGYYQKTAANLDIGTRTHFISGSSDETLRDYYQASDCYILPSVNNSEGFGLTLLEAMAVGTPTITTTEVGLAPWLTKHNLSLLIPAYDSDALAHAITTVITQFPTQMVQRAQEFAHTLTQEIMVEKTVEVYSRYVKLRS